MVQGTFAGGTNYSSQTLSHLKSDIRNFEALLETTISNLENSLESLKEEGYWETVPVDFQQLIEYTIRWFGGTALQEIRQIRRDMRGGVKESHVSRLRKIGGEAIDLNMEYGRVWHQEYAHKAYGEPRFRIVEAMYAEGRDMMATLMDVQNLAGRLADFIDSTPWYKKWWIIAPWMIGIISGIYGIVQIVINL